MIVESKLILKFSLIIFESNIYKGHGVMGISLSQILWNVGPLKILKFRFYFCYLD